MRWLLVFDKQFFSKIKFHFFGFRRTNSRFPATPRWTSYTRLLSVINKIYSNRVLLYVLHRAIYSKVVLSKDRRKNIYAAAFYNGRTETTADNNRKYTENIWYLRLCLFLYLELVSAAPFAKYSASPLGQSYDVYWNILRLRNIMRWNHIKIAESKCGNRTGWIFLRRMVSYTAS